MKWPWTKKPEPGPDPLLSVKSPPSMWRDVEVHFCNGQVVAFTVMDYWWQSYEDGGSIYEYPTGRELVMLDVSHIIKGPVRRTPEPTPADAEKTE